MHVLMSYPDDSSEKGVFIGGGERQFMGNSSENSRFSWAVASQQFMVTLLKMSVFMLSGGVLT